MPTLFIAPIGPVPSEWQTTGEPPREGAARVLRGVLARGAERVLLGLRLARPLAREVLELLVLGSRLGRIVLGPRGGRSRQEEGRPGPGGPPGPRSLSPW